MSLPPVAYIRTPPLNPKRNDTHAAVHRPHILNQISWRYCSKSLSLAYIRASTYRRHTSVDLCLCSGGSARANLTTLWDNSALGTNDSQSKWFSATSFLFITLFPCVQSECWKIILSFSHLNEDKDFSKIQFIHYTFKILKIV